MQLIVDSYGAYVHIKDELFEIRLKNEEKEIKKHFASQKISTIILSKGAAISTDAIILAMKNNIDIVVLEYDGKPVGRFWHSKLGSTSKIRKKQLEASLNNQGVFWIKKWITSKISNQSEFITRLKKHRPSSTEYIEEKIKQLKSLEEKIISTNAELIQNIDEQVRGIEGTAGRIYFETLSNLLTTQYRFNGRSSRPAKDPFNAFLNYTYGILYSRVEKVLIIAGIDPYVGFMHRDDYNQKSMVFDFIEPYRIYAEETVFKLFSAKKIKDSHCDKITNGYSLNTEGKQMLVQHFFKFFEEEKIKYKGRHQVRANIMQLDAHEFANILLKN